MLHIIKCKSNHGFAVQVLRKGPAFSFQGRVFDNACVTDQQAMCFHSYRYSLSSDAAFTAAGTGTMDHC